jgi:AraC-like DNA-binding protein
VSRSAAKRQEATSRLTGEDLPILSIALECGYGSIGPFNRVFRQRFGMTPTEYRAAARMERLLSPAWPAWRGRVRAARRSR